MALSQAKDGRFMREGSITGEARRCVAALAARQEELQRALAGRSLRVAVDYSQGATLRVVFTRGGLVGISPADDVFEPQVELRGSDEDIGAFLRERISLADAVLARLVILRMPEDEVAGFQEVRRLVADVLDTLD